MRPALLVLAVVTLSIPAGARPALPAPQQLPAASPYAAEGEAVVSLLRQEKFAEVVSRLQPAIAAALTEPQLRAAWTTLGAQVGPFKQMLSTRVVPSGRMQVAVVTCQFEGAVIDVQVGFDAEGRIGALVMRPSTSPAAAVALARSTPRVDRTRVFVLGHSLGGTLAPRIGAADPGLKGLIVMAGAVRSVPQSIVDQMTYMAMLDGRIDPPEQQQIDEVAKLGATIAALTPADAGKPQMYLGAAASYWLDLRSYDPPAAARSLTQPMLVLQGERDYQVTMADFAKWKEALGGRADVVFHSYAPLNHLFMPGAGPANPGEYGVAGHVPESVVRDISTWVQAQR